ncbi:hypothetical protein, partial [Rhizobium leguminosarum]|uniref:hypothetical protein n=1 Tax=Rhizobium leguminosarum TaxID=384 RepID=UPI00197CEFA1
YFNDVGGRYAIGRKRLRVAQADKGDDDVVGWRGEFRLIGSSGTAFVDLRPAQEKIKRRSHCPEF